MIIAGAAFCLISSLGGCAAPLVAGVPTIVFTEVVPRAVNGKGLVEDGVDLVTGEDCRVIEGAVRDDRHVCEPRNSPATKKDFKGLAGASDDQPSSAPQKSEQPAPVESSR